MNFFYGALWMPVSGDRPAGNRSVLPMLGFDLVIAHGAVQPFCPQGSAALLEQQNAGTNAPTGFSKSISYMIAGGPLFS